MRRAILWLDDHSFDVIMGTVVFALSTMLASVVVFLACGHGYHDPLPPAEMLRLAPFGAAIVIGATGSVFGICRGWRALVAWAKSPPEVKPAAQIVGTWGATYHAVAGPPPAVVDPFLEAARREVNEIAPDDA